MTSHPNWPHDRQLHAWWVTPALLADEYPGDRDPDAARAKIGLLGDAGITSIVDLTTPDDHLLPYVENLPATGGMSLDESLGRIAQARAGTRKSHRQFLETGAQREFFNSRLGETD